MKKFTKSTSFTQHITFEVYMRMREVGVWSTNALYAEFKTLFQHDYAYAQEFWQYSASWKFDFREICEYVYNRIPHDNYHDEVRMALAIKKVVSDPALSREVDTTNLSLFIHPETNQLALSHLSANCISQVIESWGIPRYLCVNYLNDEIIRVIGRNEDPKLQVYTKKPILKHQLKFGRVSQDIMIKHNITSAHMREYPNCPSGQVRKITAPIL